MAGTGTKRIIELTEASTVQSGDFIAVDSNARGTKKVSTDTLATSAALTAETNARTGADEQMSERMDGIEEQTALIQNPTKTVSGSLVSFTDGAAMPMVACTAEIVPKQSGTGTPSPDNVRAISGWTEVKVIVSPTQEATDGHTTTTSLGRTVYGGTLDVVSGVLTVDRAMITLDGSESWLATTADPNAYFYTFVSGMLSSNIPNTPIVCDKFPSASATERGNEGTMWGIYGQIHIHATDEMAPSGLTSNGITELKAWLSANNTQVCYPLATPQTYQLTPTEVNTLLGENNVWADSGDVEITYRRDISIVLENLENALSGSNSLNTMMMSAPTENTAEEPTEDEAEDDMR